MDAAAPSSLLLILVCKSNSYYIPYKISMKRVLPPPKRTKPLEFHIIVVYYIFASHCLSEKASNRSLCLVYISKQLCQKVVCLHSFIIKAKITVMSLSFCSFVLEMSRAKHNQYMLTSLSTGGSLSMLTYKEL